MTSQERVFYESFVGHIELREEMVRRGRCTVELACVMRNGVGLLAALFVALRLAEMTGQMPWLDGLAVHSATIGFSLFVALLFASANLWYARQRLQESQASLLAFIHLLPSPAEFRSSVSDQATT